mmetsp:Transcript_57275/g.125780  ORF Transcript_57275/g.125780 Transcript_57275/m.125780 type:complete len:230 (+) Transcript_57275:846-1535(+)
MWRAGLLHHLLPLVPRDKMFPIDRGQHAGDPPHGPRLRDLHLLRLLSDLLRKVRQAEVDNLQRRARAAVHKEDVLRLDVSVNDAPVMAILCGREDLLHHKAHVALGHRLLQPLVVVQDPREEVAAFAKFCDEVNVAIRYATAVELLFEVHLMHLHDVGMVQRLEQSDLRVYELALQSGLHSHHLASTQLLCLLVAHHHHLAKGTGADISEKLIVVEDCQAADVSREHDL